MAGTGEAEVQPNITVIVGEGSAHETIHQDDMAF
jgi:hypothetical protein